LVTTPSIRFFRSPTGHRVAYALHGRGPALVCTGWWVSHVEEDWKHEGFRRFFCRLGEHFSVYRYDRPGTGLSDRERDRVALEDEVATIEALFEHEHISRASLFGLSCGGPTALAFAHLHPEQIDRIALFGSFARGDSVAPAKVREAVQQLVRVSWGLGAKVLTDLLDPHLNATERKALTSTQRASASPEMAAELLRLTFEADVRGDVDGLEIPVLVAHRRGDRTIPFEAGRELAAVIPGATLCSLEGDAHVPWHGDGDAAADAILAFLRPGAVTETADAGPREPSFVREGEVFRITFGGETAHLKASRGLADLALLLAHPGREFHARTLHQGVDPNAPLDPRGASDDDVLDPQALAAYRARLAELDSQLEAGSISEASVHDERQAIARELRAAVGLGGRRSKLDPTSERARKAVSARIRAAITKVTEGHAAAGLHLAQSITTGTFCVYEPAEAVSWTVIP